MTKNLVGASVGGEASMRDVNIVFLSAGDRERIVEMFPFVDQSEDDSGALAMQALLKVSRFNLSSNFIIARCKQIVPPDFSIESFITDVERELGAARTHLDTVDIEAMLEHFDCWFLVTWSTSQEEEDSHVTATIH